MEKSRLRIRFSKTGDLRWISHRDLARTWERLLRRANLKMVYSEGFHPKPKINFPSALALGTEAMQELVEIDVAQQIDLPQIEATIRREMPQGMELVSIESIPFEAGKTRVTSATYRIPAPAEKWLDLEQRIAQLKAHGAVEVEREKRSVRCDFSDPAFDISLDGGTLVFTLPLSSEGSLRPSEILDCLGLPELLEEGTVLQRSQMHIKDPGRT